MSERFAISDAIRNNPFVQKFHKRPDPAPFGYYVLANLNKAIDNALLSDEDVPMVLAGLAEPTNSDSSMVIVDGRKMSQVIGVKCSVMVIISPKNLEMSDTRASHIVVIGGNNIHFNKLRCKTLTIYGTAKVKLSNTMVDDTFVTISDQVTMAGEYYMALNTLMSCVEFKSKGVRTLKDKFYMLGMGSTDITTLGQDILEGYPNMFIGTPDYPHFMHGFKIEPTVIHKRITWLIWAMYNVDHREVNTKQCHMECLLSKEINDAAPHLRMARFAQERNRYYEFFNRPMYPELTDRMDPEVERLSTQRRDISALDIIPSRFATLFPVIKPTYRIKL